MKQNNLLIGVTGNIGSGKSTLCKLIAKHGYTVISADEITPLAYTIAKDKLELHFGKDIFQNNGEISKEKLGEIVFSNKFKLEILNSIMHPVILDTMFSMASKSQDTVFLEMPLLFECNLQSKFDEIWFVTCDNEVKIKRVMVRNNLSYENAKKRLDSQNQNEELKRSQSHIIFLNNGTLDDLETAVTKEIMRL